MQRTEASLPQVNVRERRILGPQEIPVSKLMSLAKKDDLMDFLELTGFREIEHQLKVENDGKFKLSDMKKYILEHNDFLERFRRSAVAGRLYDKYTERLRLQNSEEGIAKQTRQRQMSKMMKTARRKYVGCIATRTSPEIYEECLDEYNDPTK